MRSIQLRTPVFQQVQFIRARVQDQILDFTLPEITVCEHSASSSVPFSQHLAVHTTDLAAPQADCTAFIAYPVCSHDKHPVFSCSRSHHEIRIESSCLGPACGQQNRLYACQCQHTCRLRKTQIVAYQQAEPAQRGFKRSFETGAGSEEAVTPRVGRCVYGTCQSPHQDPAVQPCYAELQIRPAQSFQTRSEARSAGMPPRVPR